jgi:tetratricopeptide (TPR) repeat protein
LWKEALNLAVEIGDEPGQHAALRGLGLTAEDAGEYQSTRAHYQHGLRLAEAAADRRQIATSLYGLGYLAWVEDDLETAQELCERSAALWRQQHTPQEVAHSSSPGPGVPGIG